ncbi:MAG TPA: glycosyltransferase family 39 protein, partial [Coleofasciculaceae cyanobacterium]
MSNCRLLGRLPLGSLMSWQDKPIKNYVLSFKRIHFLLLIILAIGILFRFANIDKKVYWYDEVFTSLRISGYTEAEVVQQVSVRRDIGIEDLQKYQRSHSQRGLVDTIKSLALEDPQHPPLYYSVAHFWTQWFGSSVAVIRRLSAFISLLVFPCIYWLCIELFESPLVALIAVALVAVSPYHILLAQDARQYSLWTVTILLSSASLLRAMRVNTKASWGMYGVSVMLGLYSFLLSGLVVIGHGIYLSILSLNNERFKKDLSAYLVTVFAAVFTSLPWLSIVFTNLSEINKNLNKEAPIPLWTLIKMWIRNLTSIFFDAQWTLKYLNPEQVQFSYDNPLTYAALPILLLIGYSIYFTYHKTSKRVSLFILILIVLTGLSLLLPDLILGGQRSITTRYLIPSYLGIQISVASCFAHKISTIVMNMKLQRVWQTIMLVLISGSILSCIITAQAETWWIKGSSYQNPQIARIINQANTPFVISDTKVGRVISLSYLLAPKVRLKLMPTCHTCRLAPSSV